MEQRIVDKKTYLVTNPKYKKKKQRIKEKITKREKRERSNI